MDKKEKQPVTEKTKKKTLSFFLIGFPTLMIILLMSWFPGTALFAAIIALYQFITLKQFLDQYYEEVY